MFKKEQLDMIASASVEEVKSGGASTGPEVKVGEPLSALVAVPSVCIQDLTTDGQMLKAFGKFGYVKPSIEDMARFIEFSDEEVELASIFMRPDFDTSWFYLSPKFIVERIGYNSPKAFYKALRNTYRETTDFKVIGADDALIQEWKIKDPAGSLIPEAPKRGRPVEPHAIVGSILKDVLQQAGTIKAKQIRHYFVKVEKLVVFMDKYIGILHLYASEQRRVEIERRLYDQNARLVELEAQTKDLDQRTKFAEQFVKARSLQGPNGYVYIATTQADRSVNRFKIGITTNLAVRLDVYNKTFSNSTSKVHYCAYFRVLEPRIVEKIIGIALKPYHLINDDRARQDESYIANLGLIHSVVADICAKHVTMVEATNARLDTFKADIFLPSLDMRCELPPTQLAIEMKGHGFDTVNLSNPSEADTSAMCSFVITKLVNVTHPGYRWPTDKDEELGEIVTIDWAGVSKCVKNLLGYKQKTFPVNIWKPRFHAAISGAKSVAFKCNKSKTWPVTESSVGPTVET